MEQKLTKSKAKKIRQAKIRQAKREQEILDGNGKEMFADVPEDPASVAKRKAEEKKIDDAMCEMAGAVWKFICDHNLNEDLRASWRKQTWEEKHQIMSTMFPDFTKGEPVVSKFMLFHNQYSERAFRRYLMSCRENKPNARPTILGDKKKKEEVMAETRKLKYTKFSENNANYAVYLMEAYYPINHPGKKPRNVDRMRVYKQNYEALIKEFESMEESKKNAEKTIEETRKEVDTSTVVESLSALADKNLLGSLDERTKLDLLESLRKLVTK
jgi:hypothetical protein